jgi:hypothetical protein
MAENIEIEHGGKSYTANLNGVAEVQYIESRSAPHNGEVDYLWELTGAHTGDPIRVWMLGIGEEFDEDGRTVGWDRLVWADDESKFQRVKRGFRPTVITGRRLNQRLGSASTGRIRGDR